jgi:hypothetical protein
MPVEREHLTRWARSADPVVIVLWDCVADLGYFTRVYDQPKADNETTWESVYLRPERLFDAESVLRLAWQSRVEHYHRLILEACEWLEDDEFFGVESEEERGKPRRLLTSYAVDLLHMFGVMGRIDDRWTMSDSGRRIFARELVKAQADSDDPVASAAIATSLGHAAVHNVGLPTAVVSEMAKVICTIAEDTCKKSELGLP